MSQKSSGLTAEDSQRRKSPVEPSEEISQRPKTARCLGIRSKLNPVVALHKDALDDGLAGNRQDNYDAKLQAAIKAAKWKRAKSPGPVFISRSGSKAAGGCEEGRDTPGKGGSTSSSWWSWISLGVARVWQSAQAEELVFVKV